MNPRAIIADDEPHLNEYLVTQLAQLWPELTVVGVAANGLDALRMIDDESPDIVFLDIKMPGLSGLDVARKLAEGVGSVPQIVFVTAYDQYAVEAFDREAVDYLLKPVTPERLERAISRLKSKVTSAPAAGTPGPETATDLAALLARLTGALPSLAPPPPARLQWIRASQGTQVQLIAIDDVIYFEANDKYTSVFTADGEALIRVPLKDLIEQLDPAVFWQIHRGTIVNVRHVAGSSRDFRGRVVVKLKQRPEPLVVSRGYTHLFRQM